MAIVNITINGQKLEARSGQTVLQASEEAGIHIPVLCHHPALAPQGACRLCLVEIEKQRTLQPACTYPITEGMVAFTESEKVVAARKFILEMLFSERIHYCMYCPVSGGENNTDCKLQEAAYRYGLDSWQYAPNYAKRWPVDASRKYFVMDHSRCILCRRCIRACDELVANHTLGLRDRGAKTMVVADGGVPFGASSCVSCGTCLQVCPTGALIDRRSAFQGRETDVERTRTTCLACAVGCGIEAVTRHNSLLRVEGDWEAANQGILCVAGRFEVVEPQPKRITKPLIRRDGKLAEAGWDEALALVAGKLRGGKAGGLASPRLTNEELAAFAHLFKDPVGGDDVALLGGEVPSLGLGSLPANIASLADVQASDCIVVVGGDPLEDQKVLGYLLRRCADNGRQLIVVAEGSSLAPHATASHPLRNVAKIKAAVEKAERPVVLFAGGLDEAVYAVLRSLPSKTRFMPLVTGANAAGAARAGLMARPVAADSLLVYAGDDHLSAAGLPKAGFLAVMAAYEGPWLREADVVLPALTWTEKSGHTVNLEGRELPLVACTTPPDGVVPDVATLARLHKEIAS
jgi:formate dehydrogenase major subunit